MENKGQIAVISMVRNDTFFADKWIEYYGTQFGFKNLYLFIDGLDQDLPTKAYKINYFQKPHKPQKRAAGDRNRARMISNFANKLFSDYQVVLAMDIDEFLVLDPIKNTSLKDYLLQDFSTSSRSALGLDVGQHPTLEHPIDHDKTFLSQREFAQLSSRYTKPVVAFKPLTWGSGFHRVKGKNYTIDNHLYLFHFGLVDYLSAISKVSDKEIKDAGWKDHLERRFNLYRLLKEGIIYQESFIEKGRKTLQKKRSWFSWNKPAPLKGHALIKIPERFNSIV